jgi:flagellar biosynthetic protein FliQ
MCAHASVPPRSALRRAADGVRKGSVKNAAWYLRTVLSQDELLRLATEALSLALYVSAPALGVSALVGLIVATASATTQIQDQALSHVPKVAAVALVLLASAGWMSAEITTFTRELFTALPSLVH